MAFRGCEDLKRVTIPDGVTEISDGTFLGCEELRYVTIPESVTRIGREAFRSCTRLKEITLPSGLIRLGGQAFRGCTGLTEVTLPGRLTEIPEGAFRDCTGLTEITFPDCLTEIKDRAFCGCKGITEVKFGRSSLKTIGEEAFRGCAGLPAITLPGSVESLGANAFGWCGALRSVTLTDCEGIPYAFSGCRSLLEFIIPAESTRYSSVDGVLLTRWSSSTRMRAWFVSRNTRPTRWRTAHRTSRIITRTIPFGSESRSTLARRTTCPGNRKDVSKKDMLTRSQAACPNLSRGKISGTITFTNACNYFRKRL